MMARIAKVATLLATLLATFACCPCRHLATGTTDSVRVEVRERVDNITSDTTSRIETSAAISTATVSNGKLYHALWNKQQPIGVKVDMEFTVEDVTKEHLTTIREIVEVPRELTWWQQTQMRGFWALLLVVGLFVSKGRIVQLFR